MTKILKLLKSFILWFKEFAASVDEFLSFRKYDILKDEGSVSRQNADSFAKAEYDEFNKVREFVSDFDKTLENNEK